MLRRPALRERLVWDHEEVVSDEILKTIMRTLVFYWPHDIKHGFVFDPDTSLWEFTTELQASLNDINHWRLDDSFLGLYPQYEDAVLPLSKLQEFIILWRMPEMLDEKNPYREEYDPKMLVKMKA